VTFTVTENDLMTLAATEEITSKRFRIQVKTDAGTLEMSLLVEDIKTSIMNMQVHISLYLLSKNCFV
jgi:hypothetical protein